MASTQLPTEDPDENDYCFDTNLNEGPHEMLIQSESKFAGLWRRPKPLTKEDYSLMDVDHEYEEEENTTVSGRFRLLVVSMSIVVIFALVAVLSPGIPSNSDRLKVLGTPARIPVAYACRNSEDHSKENFEPAMVDLYDTVSKTITDDMTEFLAAFRESNYDNWGKTYNQVKEGMHNFKSTYFPPYLQDGSTIYESASGIGMNLYMTLEILQETNGVENLYVYGNELLESSVSKANAVFDHIAPAKSRKGVMCAGDSNHLEFVPSNSFDLVYSGYISPLFDPLKLGMGRTANYGRYTELCMADATTQSEDAALNKIAQEIQNDWYGNWVAEMARIAKPGVPVIVEQVASTYCENRLDWGGVKKEWWQDVAANNTYGWNIDPSSIVFEDDTVFHNRYHVFMLKNGKRVKQ